MRKPSEPERAQCDKILASLVRQLACPSRNNLILEPVLRKYEEIVEFEHFNSQVWTTNDSTAMLIELISVYPAVTLVLDALDEVDIQDRQDLLDALMKIIQESQSLVKIFVSSRDSMDLAIRLKTLPNLSIDSRCSTGDIAIEDFVYHSVPSCSTVFMIVCDTFRDELLQSLLIFIQISTIGHRETTWG